MSSAAKARETETNQTSAMDTIVLIVLAALQTLKSCAPCTSYPVIWNTRTWGLTPAKAQSTPSSESKGRWEKEPMKEKIKYTNEPIGKLRIIEDFLPPPSELGV
jgi:hypothetical protein